MTDAEVTKIFYMVSAAYPRFFKDMTQQQASNYIDAWNMVFADKGAMDVYKGLQFYMCNDTQGYPPSPGQIIDCMHKLKPESTMNEMEAWQLVEKAVRNSCYNADEEFNKLPQVIRRCVRNPGVLREWAKMDESEFMTVIQSNFMRSFRVEQQKEVEIQKAPIPIRPALEEIGNEEAPRIEIKENQKGNVPDDAINDMIERLRKQDEL